VVGQVGSRWETVVGQVGNSGQADIGNCRSANVDAVGVKSNNL